MLGRLRKLGLVVIAGALGVYSLGCCVFSAPGFEGDKSGHFDGERFHNLAPTPPKRFAAFWQWTFTRTPGEWRERVESEPGPKPPEKVGEGELRVTFVGHATALIQIDGLNFLTDPQWSERASPVTWAGPKRVRDPGIRFEDLPPLDAVLVSHNHYDHLDIETLRRISIERPAPIFVGLGVNGLLEEEEIPGGREFDWWDSVQITPQVRVHFVPAQHFSARGLCDRNETLWGGFVIESPHGAVYFAGDTGWGPHFEMIAERYGPIRLALIPIGAYLPRWFMAPVHTSPAEAVKAHQVLGAHRSMGIHFGTFRLADDSEYQPVEELEQAREESGVSEDEFWVLGFGEGRDVPALDSTPKHEADFESAGDVAERPPAAK